VPENRPFETLAGWPERILPAVRAATTTTLPNTLS